MRTAPSHEDLTALEGILNEKRGMHRIPSMDELRQIGAISRVSSMVDLASVAEELEGDADLSNEVQFLRDIGTHVSAKVKSHLVCHRGFHDTGDAIHRPIENTLPAFDQAWLSGLPLCECDIAGTLDERLILAHDESLQRVALLPDEVAASSGVETMNIAQIMALSLKSGVRVPLLQEVLQSACFIPGAQLVIELKPGSTNVAPLLINLFTARPEFIARTAVIMSFDLYLIHSVKARYDECCRVQAEAAACADWDMAGPCPVAKHPKFMWLSCHPTNPDPQSRHWDDEDDGAVYKRIDTADIDRILELIKRDSCKLDGIYVEYHPEYLAEKKHVLQRLAEHSQLDIGMWNVTPDSAPVAEELIDMGVLFVNTDLPRTFVQDLPKRLPKTLEGE